MGKNKLLTGVTVGALVGAAITMMDKRTRTDVTLSLKNTGFQAKKYIMSPSVAVHDFRENCENVSRTLNEGINDVYDAMEQMQGYLEKIGEVQQKPND